MEITVTTRGESCHASAPERGRNAVTAMTRIVQGIDALNAELARRGDPFLGPGTAAVTRIASESPSLNAVPDRCEIFIDRRLTAGETRDSALAEIRRIAGNEGEVSVLVHEAESWTGKRVSMEKTYPTWTLAAEHASVRAALGAAREALGREPELGRWTFSTNGVYTAGIEGIPTLGFGPAEEEYTHSVQDRVSEADLERAIRFYALFPRHFASA
jgi:putative selenium metabolism hydrolase